MVVELFTVPPGGMYTLQLEDKAHMEKAEAMGPNVPAMRGHAVDSNQYRLQGIVSAKCSLEFSKDKITWGSYNRVLLQDLQNLFVFDAALGFRLIQTHPLPA